MEKIIFIRRWLHYCYSYVSAYSPLDSPAGTYPIALSNRLNWNTITYPLFYILATAHVRLSLLAIDNKRVKIVIILSNWLFVVENSRSIVQRGS